ncbi:hypothetical protein CYMTET_32850 [Cymbomonas tetramitiformis]|uniref:Uncharacterized protein n=1 Tax=Cymbomonas tetramitiformis TaxID=36881 RepID=A0AAE0FEU1_9CHLO|nr:hypothetical protein CYMTET_32850 [Cymbomonas tetramitiformis]
MTPEEKRAKALQTYAHAQGDKERKMQEKIDAKMRKQNNIAMLKLAKKPHSQGRAAEATRLRQATAGLAPGIPPVKLWKMYEQQMSLKGSPAKVPLSKSLDYVRVDEGRTVRQKQCPFPPPNLLVSSTGGSYTPRSARNGCEPVHAPPPRDVSTQYIVDAPDDSASDDSDVPHQEPRQPRARPASSRHQQLLRRVAMGDASDSPTNSAQPRPFSAPAGRAERSPLAESPAAILHETTLLPCHLVSKDMVACMPRPDAADWFNQGIHAGWQKRRHMRKRHTGSGTPEVNR